MSNDMDYIVTHIDRKLRFEITVEGMTCELEYRHFDGGIVITHTYVPSALEGRGIAAALVKAVVDYANKNSIRIVPQCSYAVTYFKRHNIEWTPILG